MQLRELFFIIHVMISYLRGVLFILDTQEDDFNYQTYKDILKLSFRNCFARKFEHILREIVYE